MKLRFSYLALLLAGLLTASCGSEDGGQAAATAPAGPKPYPVTTVPTQTVTAFTDYPARITGIVSSEVRAKIAGYITDVLVDDGDRVRKGQLLFRLETQTLNEDAGAARANVNAAQVEVDKLKPLVEKNIISEVQLETAKARLQQAQSGLNSINSNINYGRITSPIDGYLGRIAQRTGSLVSPTSPEPLTTVSDISKVYAYFAVTERQYLNYMQSAVGATKEEKLSNLPKVQLVLSNGQIYEHEGTIEAVISQVNAQTGTIQIRAVFDNPARLLNDGNSGSIRVPRVYEDVVVVPKTATYDQQGTTYVFRVDTAGTVSAAPLEITTEVGNLFVIASGLQAGDRIVASGQGQLAAGTRIEAVPTPFDSIARPVPTVFR